MPDSNQGPFSTARDPGAPERRVAAHVRKAIAGATQAKVAVPVPGGAQKGPHVQAAVATPGGPPSPGAAESRSVAPHVQAMIAAGQAKTVATPPPGRTNTAPHVQAMIAAGQATRYPSAPASPRTPPAATAQLQPAVRAHKGRSGLVGAMSSGSKNVIQPAALEEGSAPPKVKEPASLSEVKAVGLTKLYAGRTGGKSLAHSEGFPDPAAVKRHSKKASIEESKALARDEVAMGAYRTVPIAHSLWTDGLANCIGLLLIAERGV